MSTQLMKEQKIVILKWFWKSESVTLVQQEFQRQFQSKPLKYPAIISVVKKLDVTGTVEDLPCSGQSVTTTMAKR